MDWTVVTYVVYLLVTIPLTVWVATALSRHGEVFLGDVFAGREALAHAVNRLLVVGFYLLNLGFVSLLLRAGGTVGDLRELVEQLSVKVGVVTLAVGIVHFLNVWAFAAIRRRHELAALRAAPYPPYGMAAPIAPYPAAYPAP